MSEYNQVQEEYRDKTKHRITRQLQVAGREATEEEVEELLESGTNVFLKHVRS
jgi:syntaxin 1A